MDRRTFLKTTAMVSASSVLGQDSSGAQTVSSHRIVVRVRAAETPKTRLAARELLTGIRTLGIAQDVSIQTENSAALALSLFVDHPQSNGPESYEILQTSADVEIHAANDQALLYAVFDFLERQGMVFGIDGAITPIEPRHSLRLPQPGQPWNASPRFAVRGLLPWPDFLNCISIYNNEDFHTYFANMLRMRLNMFGMHVYTQNEPGPMAESYLSFDFAGAGHKSALEDTTMTSWGYLPQKTSSYKMGAAEFFDSDTFGSDATRNTTDIWDTARRTTDLLRSAFSFAADLGIRTGIGFEPYQNPAEIVRALPPEALSFPGGFIESRTARDLLERRLADLLERYPMVDDIWLWQDEHANWQSRKTNVPLSITPFAQAHDFLKRHAPHKHLVLAGWGGVARHFNSLHQRLPEDIIFSALNDTVGWDPVSDAFSKLEGRERWPIPWLEDDPAMWLPQFRASRFEMDMKRAESFGCQGMLGIHWRHRIVDPTASYFARAAWDRNLTATVHYTTLSRSLVAQERSDRLATLFDNSDRKRAISSTFLGTYSDANFANEVELTGDYNEAFNYATTKPVAAVLASQRTTAEQFRRLEAEATSPLEKNRIGYFAGFVSMMVPYCDALDTAHQLDQILKHAVELRAASHSDQALSSVATDGIPLWLSIASNVRAAMLDFQRVVATRNDQGQLASMQNKFVRIALERLRLSIQEFVGDLPPNVNAAYAAAIAPDQTSHTGQTNPVRIFLPTRPSLLRAGESLRIFIIAPGARPGSVVTWHTRSQGKDAWNTSAANHVSRSVYSAQLGPINSRTIKSDEIAIEYYATIDDEQKLLSDPPNAPHGFYTAILYA